MANQRYTDQEQLLLTIQYIIEQLAIKSLCVYELDVTRDIFKVSFQSYERCVKSRWIQFGNAAGRCGRHGQT